MSSAIYRLRLQCVNSNRWLDYSCHQPIEIANVYLDSEQHVGDKNNQDK